MGRNNQRTKAEKSKKETENFFALLPTPALETTSSVPAISSAAQHFTASFNSEAASADLPGTTSSSSIPVTSSQAQQIAAFFDSEPASADLPIPNLLSNVPTRRIITSSSSLPTTSPTAQEIAAFLNSGQASADLPDPELLSSVPTGRIITSSPTSTNFPAAQDIAAFFNSEPTGADLPDYDPLSSVPTGQNITSPRNHLFTLKIKGKETEVDSYGLISVAGTNLAFPKDLIDRLKRFTKPQINFFFEHIDFINTPFYEYSGLKFYKRSRLGHFLYRSFIGKPGVQEPKDNSFYFVPLPAFVLPIDDPALQILRLDLDGCYFIKTHPITLPSMSADQSREEKLAAAAKAITAQHPETPASRIPQLCRMVMESEVMSVFANQGEAASRPAEVCTAFPLCPKKDVGEAKPPVEDGGEAPGSGVAGGEAPGGEEKKKRPRRRRPAAPAGPIAGSIFDFLSFAAGGHGNLLVNPVVGPVGGAAGVVGGGARAAGEEAVAVGGGAAEGSKKKKKGKGRKKGKGKGKAEGGGEKGEEVVEE